MHKISVSRWVDELVETKMSVKVGGWERGRW